jgi:hypothetical protein
VSTCNFSLAKDKAPDWQFPDCLIAEGTYLATPLGNDHPVKLGGVEELV